MCVPSRRKRSFEKRIHPGTIVLRIELPPRDVRSGSRLLRE
jgi:hypothetical protein